MKPEPALPSPSSLKNPVWYQSQVVLVEFSVISESGQIYENQAP
ncbi:MAG TPA: hypothetical protein PLL06_12485 [Acidobacteriota bacterium]|nr:hypothetical protein [Acidobacteriota bacterium]HMZ80510.1 hypothetical protein [Acidobacteriota bacterium]HNB74343.1 hypothetical protein [Acidobacteriota bacterium]HNG93556.1 hypothetical protein [Acidobacteriota bacterium]HNH82053.1 hypothetical protein [Acidobacteriota bacterium]